MMREGGSPFDEQLRLALELMDMAEDWMIRSMLPDLRMNAPEGQCIEMRWARCCIQIARELVRRAREVEG